MIMLIAGEETIRDVIAFPKVQNASELMSACPAPADPKALSELSLCIVDKE
jgi:aspartyl-tRNA synthetase